jgi:hypothetical protein
MEQTISFIQGGKIIGEFPLENNSTFGEREKIGHDNGLTDWEFHCIMIDGKFATIVGGVIWAQDKGNWRWLVLLDEKTLTEVGRSLVEETTTVRDAQG